MAILRQMFLASLIFTILSPTVTTATEPAAVEVPPIRRIVFFSSGVAQIFHEGEISGDVKINLSLPPNEIEDALRSLIIEDKKGTVGGVQYQVAPSQRTTAAANFPPMSLAQILQKHRGQEIRFQSDQQEIIGKVVSVETRTRDESSREVIVILNQEGMQSFDLDAVEKINFINPELRSEIDDALLGLTEQDTKNSKQLSIILNGKEKRIVRISYLINAPVWLTTYRIDMQDNDASVQAWAHVDNVTLNDWQEVQIELRSGQPRTFHIDLMSPIMIRRANVENVFGIDPSADVYSPFQSLATTSSEFDRWRGGPGGGGFGGGGGGGFGGAGGGAFGSEEYLSDSEQNKDSSTKLDINTSFRARSVTSKSLQSVKFKIEEPVSIAAGQSSAIPIFNQTVRGELLSQFSADQSNDKAEHALTLTNGTEFPFLPGPVSTFINGEFVGESTMDRVPVSTKTTLIYGTDQSVSVTRSRENATTTVTEAKLVQNGQKLAIKSTTSTAMKFTIKNSSTEPRKVVVGVPFDQNQSNQRLKPAPTNFKDSSAMYEIYAGEKESTTLTVDWLMDKVVVTQIEATSNYRDSLERWKNDGVISVTDYEILSAIKSLNQQIAQVVTKRLKLKSDRKALTESQARIATLLKAIGVESVNGKAYVTKIIELEKELAEIDQKISDFDREIETLRKE